VTDIYSYEQFFEANDQDFTPERSILVYTAMGSFYALILILLTVTYSRDITDNNKQEILDLMHTAQFKKKRTVHVEQLVLDDLPEENSEETYYDNLVRSFDDQSDGSGNHSREREMAGHHGHKLQEKQLRDSAEYRAINAETVETALPAIYRQSRHIAMRVLSEFAVYHRWASVFLHNSEIYSRSYRVCALACHVLYPAFFMSLGYVYTNPDDGTCSSNLNERVCLDAALSLIPEFSRCYWVLSTHTCRFRQPTTSFQTIIIVTIVSALVSVPAVRLTEYLLIKISVPCEKEDMSRGRDVITLKASPSLTVSWRSRVGSFFSRKGKSKAHKVNPLDDSTHSQVDENKVVYPQTPEQIQQIHRESPFKSSSPLSPLRHLDLNRFKCESFVNSCSVEVEFEVLQRRVKHYMDSLNFLGNEQLKVETLREFYI
jgi:hypothetical protein